MSGLVAVLGYMSIDTRLITSALARPGETAILEGAVLPPTRWGGCAPNVALWLRRLGVETALVAWIGDDEEGRAYRTLLADAEVDLRFLVVGSGVSPRAWLVSDRSGTSVCFFHPSGASGQRLDRIEELRAETEWLAVTVGPAQLTRSALDAFEQEVRAEKVRLAWDVKADREAFPPDLVRRLAAADLICLNEAEAVFVGDALELGRAAGVDDLLALGASVVAITRGRRGALIGWGNGAEELAGEEVAVREPTGAGDAFFAGMLAALLEKSEPPDAARRGLETAGQHLSGVTQ
jgi:sugar/nucleoside kinase (ribokinase family)